MHRFSALTGFRCLAACLIFVYHNKKYWRGSLHPEVLRIFNEFHIGVALFFVLSGFLIAYTYADEPVKSAKKYGSYILLRLGRIMPLYWLILTLFYLDPAYGKSCSPFLTYSLFHGFSDQFNLDGISQSWSLNIEMTFYFLAPLLCLLHKKHLVYLLIFLVGLFIITFGIGYFWHTYNGNPNKWLYPFKFIIGGTFAGRCTEFLAGMLLASAIRNNKTKWIEAFKFKTLIGFLGILLTTYCIGLFQTDRYHEGTDHLEGQLLMKFVLPVFVVIALAGLMYERNLAQRFFSSRMMVLLGNASFAFYLIHISYVNLKLKSYFLLPDRNFVVLWLISIMLYLLFEKPIYDLIRRKFKN